MNTRVKEIINPETNQLVKEGDVVLIYQGRFGHNNVMTIKSIWDNGRGDIVVSDSENNFGTHIGAIKQVFTQEELKKLKKDIRAFSRLSYLQEYHFVNGF